VNGQICIGLYAIHLILPDSMSVQMFHDCTTSYIVLLSSTLVSSLKEKNWLHDFFYCILKILAVSI
jgi:hypothetical protein